MNTETEIKPALTAEEWERGEAFRGDHILEGYSDGSGIGITEPYETFGVVPPEAFHAVAAWCLHNQIFGFTRGDVQFLREIRKDHEARRYVNAEEAEDLADRIEALLPPENT
jgi:hypothetical protein